MNEAQRAIDDAIAHRKSTEATMPLVIATKESLAQKSLELAAMLDEFAKQLRASTAEEKE